MYSILIKAFSRADRFKESRETFEEAMLDDSIIPDIQLMNSYLASVVRSGSYSQAEYVFDSIIELQLAPSFGTFIPLIRSRLRNGDVEGAFELYDNSLELSARLQESPPLQTFELMLDLCIKRRRWVDLTNVLRQMEDKGYGKQKMKYEEILKTFLLKNSGEIERSSDVGQNTNNLEMLKFWLGLPNEYYASRDSHSDWKWWNDSV